MRRTFPCVRFCATGRHDVITIPLLGTGCLSTPAGNFRYTCAHFFLHSLPLNHVSGSYAGKIPRCPKFRTYREVPWMATRQNVSRMFLVVFCPTGHPSQRFFFKCISVNVFLIPAGLFVCVAFLISFICVIVSSLVELFPSRVFCVHKLADENPHFTQGAAVILSHPTLPSRLSPHISTSNKI